MAPSSSWGQAALLLRIKLELHARAELASYKVPRHFRFITEDQIPLLPTGKVDRANIAQIIRRREYLISEFMKNAHRPQT